MASASNVRGFIIDALKSFYTNYIWHFGSGTKSAQTAGTDCSAAGSYSVASGKGTVTNNEAEHATGKYNKSNTNTISSIGIGTSTSARKNAFEVMNNGDVYVYNIGGFTGANAGTSGITTLQTTLNSSYIGTTPVQHTSQAQAMTGITSVTSPSTLSLTGSSTLYVTSGNSASIIFQRGGSEIGRFNTSNNLCLGLSSANDNTTNKLYVNGNTYSTADITSGTYVRAKGNDIYAGSASGSQCHMQYDNTDKCLKFIFD